MVSEVFATVSASTTKADAPMSAATICTHAGATVAPASTSISIERTSTTCVVSVAAVADAKWRVSEEPIFMPSG